VIDLLTAQTLQGVIVPIVVPFDQRKKLDMKSFKDLVKRLVSKGVHGIIIQTAIEETSARDANELDTLVITARGMMKDAALVVDIGSTGANTVHKQLLRFKRLGADAALVAPPSSQSCPAKQLVTYYNSLAGTGLPIIVHERSDPSVAAFDLTTLQNIMDESHVIGIVEGSEDIRRTFSLARLVNKPVLSGKDELFFGSLCCGARGGIVASANVDSELFVRVYELYKTGVVDAAKQLFDQLLPLVHFIYSEPYPMSLKWLLAQRGHIRSDQLRIPLLGSKVTL